ncbi:MAG: SagB/ThcOx family dehydrogenase [Desulfobacterales bacterium]
MKLPAPRTDGPVSLEHTIQSRRTVRSFDSERAISTEDLSQLLWSAQGITETGGFKRAAPSAGALYPLDIYAAVGSGSVNGMEAGVYRYDPASHGIHKITGSDVRKELAEAALHQMWMARAPVNVIITAEYSRITGKYGNRGIRYAHMEAGNVSQNLFLQAEAVGLKAGIVGAFNDRAVTRILQTPEAHEPVLIMPVGYGA